MLAPDRVVLQMSASATGLPASLQVVALTFEHVVAAVIAELFLARHVLEIVNALPPYVHLPSMLTQGRKVKTSPLAGQLRLSWKVVGLVVGCCSQWNADRIQSGCAS